MDVKILSSDEEEIEMRDMEDEDDNSSKLDSLTHCS